MFVYVRVFCYDIRYKFFSLFFNIIMLSLTMHKFFKAFFFSLQSVFNSHTHGSKTEGKPRKIWQDILVIFLFCSCRDTKICSLFCVYILC
uniref:Uncharacterized protein n=1 Tax=Octopus bimaculoides TaxID=37653 RepID=A0A0L8IH21_OCTBM